jgi:thioredoxin:protein disulfide reductase
LQWRHAEPEALAEARQAQKPLLVDFMASWCLPCKEFELKVFSDPLVAAEMQRFALLKVDLTREDDDPALGALKRKYGAETLPAIRLVAPDGTVRAKTDVLMTADAFRALLLSTRGGT